MQFFARAVDVTMEGTIALSFSRVGYRTRRRLFRWEPLAQHRLDGKVVVVTGATSGLGLEGATELASLGAHVVLVARDPEKAEKVRSQIIGVTHNDGVAVGIADLSRLSDVRRLAADLAARYDHIDVLVHNAGALTKLYTTTADGMEATLAAQVVGPFLLTGLLLPQLQQRPHSRVIFVSSGGMYSERLDVERVEMTRENYDGVKAYARAKRAQVVLVEEWAARLQGTGVTVNAMHPGWADTPGVRASLPGFYKATRRWLRTPAEGADTIVWLASSPEGARTSGKFWFDRRVRATNKVPWTRSNDAEARKLWELCEARSGWSLSS